MDGIIFDLKKFRTEYLNNMSQEEFAAQIGISQDKVSRMETNPDQITLPIIIGIAEHFGMQLNDLITISSKNVKALQPKNTWEAANEIKQTLDWYMISHGLLDNANCRAEVKELYTMVQQLFKKPKLALIGRSDVGKSTMINKLLGADRLPAKWTPTTSIAVYIKHVKDRPAYMDEDVWIFKSEPENNGLWDDSKLYDEAYCRSLKLSAGNYDLLNTYGTRMGEHYESGEATSAVAFVESDILLNCDIIDLPGYGTGDRGEDDRITLNGKSKADIIIYLSIANGFMRGEDIAYIKEVLPTLPDISAEGNGGTKPLSNFFAVASQAHIVGQRSDLTDILDSGCDRLVQSMPEDTLQAIGGAAALRSRFFTYTTNTFILREKFENELASILEELPIIIREKAVDIITRWKKDKSEAIQKAIEGYKKMMQEREECQRLLREYRVNEAQQKEAFKNQKENMCKKIQGYKEHDLKEFEVCYRATVTPSNLEELMKKRDVKKKKDEISAFSSYVSSYLNEMADKLLNESSQKFNSDVEQFLTSFENSVHGSFGKDKSFGFSTFNKKQAFAAGLAGAATYGALAIWAATCGNLGGYILVAKGVSLLSSIGISVGGTAAAASAVASIGGPVVLGVTLAVVAALATFAALSGTWRKSVAKKLVDAFRKENTLEKLQEAMAQYWRDTEKAFSVAADQLNEQWNDHLNTLEAKLNSYDTQSIEEAIKEAEAIQNFLKNIPLSKE